VNQEANASVTVITVSYNAKDSIENTIASVIAQKNIVPEFIVIDGGSDDGTTSVIERYQSRIDNWVSEPDLGTYDAMNKGVLLASREWVIFMNSGDVFANDHILGKAMKHTAQADLIYGSSAYEVGGVKQTISSRPISEIWKGMPFSHQALIVKRELLAAHPFEIRLNIAADYEFIAAMYKGGRRFVDCGELIAVMDATGVSRERRLETYAEWAAVAKQYFDRPEVAAYHRRRRMMERFKGPLRRLLPPKLIALVKSAVRHQ